jgi:histidine triad (HIT) family protein
METQECIFCKIVSGTEYSSKIYEDDKILAFMDIRPISPGEFMIIPKEHIDHFYDIPDDLAQHIMLHTQILARRLQKIFNPERVGYVVHGYGVAHAHLVIIPLNDRSDITSLKFLEAENSTIKLNFNLVPITEYPELDRIAALLRNDESDK